MTGIVDASPSFTYRLDVSFRSRNFSPCHDMWAVAAESANHAGLRVIPGVPDGVFGTVVKQNSDVSIVVGVTWCSRSVPCSSTGAWLAVGVSCVFLLFLNKNRRFESALIDRFFKWFFSCVREGIDESRVLVYGNPFDECVLGEGKNTG